MSGWSIRLSLAATPSAGCCSGPDESVGQFAYTGRQRGQLVVAQVQPCQVGQFAYTGRQRGQLVVAQVQPCQVVNSPIPGGNAISWLLLRPR